MKAENVLKNPVAKNDALVILAGFSLIIVFISMLETPANFWRILASCHLYMVWIVYGALFLKKENFYWGALVAIPVFLFFQYFVYYFPNGSISNWMHYAFPPALDMSAIAGILYVYNKKIKEKHNDLENKQAEEEKVSGLLRHELQKQRIKSENLERLIRNQEYTFSLVYKIFRSFLTSRKDFTSALYQSISRITQAEKLAIYRVRGQTLIPEKNENPGKLSKISLATDQFLREIAHSNRVFSISEISKNNELFNAWKKTSHRGLIYIPIRESGSPKYLIIVNKMPFGIFHQRTLQALTYVKKMADLALIITQEVQESRNTYRSQWQQVLQSPYDFLSFVENEFRRAKRFRSSFSLIAIRMQAAESDDKNLSVERLIQSVLSEIRELDQIYVDKPRHLIWIILPFTTFHEMSGVLNRLDKKLNHLTKETNSIHAFDYGFSVFEPDYESHKTMMKQVLEVLQIHAKILEKMSRRHAIHKAVRSN